jgi:hypothetical protein
MALPDAFFHVKNDWKNPTTTLSWTGVAEHFREHQREYIRGQKKRHPRMPYL